MPSIRLQATLTNKTRHALYRVMAWDDATNDGDDVTQDFYDILKEIFLDIESPPGTKSCRSGRLIQFLALSLSASFVGTIPLVYGFIC